MVNSVDPDQMPPFAASDLGLHCLFGLSLQRLKNTVYWISWPLFLFVMVIVPSCDGYNTMFTVVPISLVP